MSLLDDVRPDAAPAVDAPAPAASSRPVATPGQVLRRLRVPLALVALVALVGLALAFATGASSATDLDPGAPSQGGSAALAQLLADHGSPVTRTPQIPQTASGATVFVPDSSRLPTRAVARLLDLAAGPGGTDVVVVVDDDDSAAALDIDDGTDTVGGDTVTSPGCSLPYALAAGRARAGGSTFDLGNGPRGLTVTDRCYTVGGTPSLVRLAPPDGPGSLTLVGTAEWARNDQLAEDGNAALALGLLTHTGRPVTWVLPLPGESASSGEDSTGLLTLLPHRLKLAVGELAVVLLLLALWRGRRLGPVITEALPVVVRSVETVRGRARLYRGAGARDRAALALREAARARVAATLGLGPQTRPELLVRAAGASAGRRPDDVAGLLYSDRAPGDDAGLVRLATDLDQLTDEVRRP